MNNWIEIAGLMVLLASVPVLARVVGIIGRVLERF
jgi:hypothetical protein